MHISLAAETIFNLFGFPITNSMIMTWVTMVVLTVLGFFAGRNPKAVPGMLQNALEAVMEYAMGLTDSILQDKALTKRVFPLAATFFLLIVLSNWLGLLPGVGTIGFEQVEHGKTVLTPLLRATNADINSTLSWAIISIVMVQVLGVMSLGAVSYFSKFLNFKALFSGTTEGPINFGVGLLEIFGEISKIVSFSFRLFGNVFAGEVLLTVIAFLVPYVAPLPFYMLELFVGLIQGVVFTTLTLVFIKIATISHGHEHDDVSSSKYHVSGETVGESA